MVVPDHCYIWGKRKEACTAEDTIAFVKWSHNDLWVFNTRRKIDGIVRKEHYVEATFQIKT